jgi:hypothetical protein
LSDDKRFTPPAAEVTDVAAGALRPRAVQLAVTLLWVSFAVSLPALALAAARDPAAVLHPVSLVITVALLALSVLLILRIGEGRDWARWVYLVLFGISVAMQWLPGDDLNPPGYFENALSAAGWLLDAAAMWLVFTRPGADWFRRVR